jgi:tetratricopeptide (TPR) repeat protein
MSRFRTEILVGLFLVAATLAVYWHVSENEFVDFDDSKYIDSNPQVKAGLTGPGLRWAFTTTLASNWHPLTWLSLQLDAQLFGTKPWVFHRTNLLLHAANALLLFVVLRGMTGAVWRSAAVAALFAWHPLHVESVAWAAERKDVLSTLFWMLTLGAYLLYVRRPGVGRYLAVVGCLALGLLVKPMLVTLPCVLLLLDYWPLGRLRLGVQPSPRAGSTEPQAAEGPGRLLGEKVPLFALAAASCVITWYAQQKGGALASLDGLSLGMRLANAPVACTNYLAEMLYPVTIMLYPVTGRFFPFELAVYYPHPRHSPPVWVAGAVGVLLAVSALAAALARRAPYLLVGWLWYLGTLVPVIGLVQVGNQAMADRYTYVPLIGVFIALAWGGPDLLAWMQLRELVLVPITAIFLGICLCLTWIQVTVWHDSFTLWDHAIEVTRDNALAHTSLAGTYERNGEVDEALAHYREALGIDPYSVLAHTNLGNLLLAQGKSEEAFQEFAKAAQLTPHQPIPHDGMGVALLYQGKEDAAAHQFNEALRVRPEDEIAFNGLGDVWMHRGRPDQAVADYRRAVERAPTVAQYHCNLASALYDCHQREEARKEYGLATQLAPAWPQAAARQAWRLATHPQASFRNGWLAVKLARQVVQARASERPEDLDLLAAAYAEAGRFDEAVAAQQKALERAATASPPDRVKEREERLHLYQKQQPYREGPGADLPRKTD